MASDKDKSGVNIDADGEINVGRDVAGRDVVTNVTTTSDNRNTVMEGGPVAHIAVIGIIVVALVAIIAFGLILVMRDGNAGVPLVAIPTITATRVTPTPTPSLLPTFSATPPSTATPLPESPVVKTGDATWRGPSNTCTVVVDNEPVYYMRVADMEDFSDAPQPRDYFYPGHAIAAFDLSSDERIKISNIFVEVISYQPVPTITDCVPTPSPLGEAHLFIAPINKPDVAGKSRFPAYLLSKDGTPGFVWLDPGEPVSFFVLVSAQTPGLYELRCCDVELSQLDSKKIVQFDVREKILFKRPGF